MYSVVLVDDELWSLEGIYNLFDWESMGFIIIAKTTDSTEALKIINHSKPDVVFIDIRMPEISGIDLLKMSRRNNIKSEFVIISGYAEFEYAQDALREDVFDYLLKPVGRDEAKELLKKMKIHLDDKQISKDLEIYEELICSICNPYEILKTRNFSANAVNWQVVALNRPETYDGYSSVILFKGIEHMILKIGTTKRMAILNGDKSLEKNVTDSLEVFNIDKGLHVGISTVSNDIMDIARLIREADMASCNYFICDRCEIIRFNAYYSAELEITVKKLERYITAKNNDAIADMLDKTMELFQSKGLGLYHVTNLWNYLSVVIYDRFGNDAVIGKIDFLNYMEIVNRFGKLSNLYMYLKALLKDVCFPTSVNITRQRNYNENFLTLLEYVNCNYTKKLSLSELSEKFFLNMSYCCELFRKVTGYTFSDYMTKLRMEKAGKLLSAGNYTAHKVSDLTGYNDYFYFCKTFKKFYGVTPTQFLDQPKG